MIINNINPVLFKIGFLQIRYYGLIYALGFVLAYFFLRYQIKKGRLTLDNKQLDDLLFYLLIGVVMGSRLFYAIFYSPYLMFTDFLGLFRIWEGGLAFHGGLIGAVIAVYLFSKKYKIKIYDILDAIVVPGILGLALGRIANYTNHELYGYVTNVPWCVMFTDVIGCRHPYQIYAGITHLIVFGILWFSYSRQKIKGTTFWNFVLFYGIFRFITDFFKVEDKFFGMGVGQIASIAMIGIASYILLKKIIKEKEN